MPRPPWPALAGLVFGAIVTTGVVVWVVLLRPAGPPDPLTFPGIGTFTCEEGMVVATEMDGTVHRWADWEADGAIAVLERGGVDLPPGVEAQAIVEWLEACLARDPNAAPRTGPPSR